ncbi:CBS domain-containing protein [Frateuria edaphi]|jgi:CBS domain-containing protein|uniref:CBS domain-containing protein n=1 Tax=Frateuria TaxID=70411 RepID=UPI001E64C5C7|nr:CBS domain-containing protein [Frateuria edaphi]UGB46814.1 CBS domain-containing protein [Frateuria edaphi]
MDLDRVMTRNPKFCLATSPLDEVARAMRDEDVGEIPVVDLDRHPIGVITDRDIVVRTLAAGRNPLDVRVQDCMTAPPIVIKEDASLQDCAKLMERQQIRRVPVVDAKGALCGIVSLADLERTDARSLQQEVTRAVSQPH